MGLLYRFKISRFKIVHNLTGQALSPEGQLEAQISIQGKDAEGKDAKVDRLILI